MKNQLSHIGCTALFMTAAFASLHRAQAQPFTNNFFGTFLFQGVFKGEWGPCPNDAPTCFRWVDLVPKIPQNCDPVPCPDYILGTNTIAIDQDGLFTMPIVIPEQFMTNIGALSLRFDVRTNGSGPFTTLSGTLPLTATPYAAVAQSVSGPIPASSLTGTMPTGLLTGTFSSPLSFVNPANVFAGDGSLLANVNAKTIGGFAPCNLPCYWKLTGNGGTTAGVNFLGTTDNQPLELKANGQRALRLEPNAFGPNIVGGYAGNSVLTGVQSATIAGGGTLFHPDFGGPLPNQIGSGGDFGFIGGGIGNTLSGSRNAIGGGHLNQILAGNSSVIAGGEQNIISINTLNATNNTSLDSGVIGGGYGNILTNLADAAAIAGGYNNTASNIAAFIGGGGTNLAGGIYSVVAGGFGNQAVGSQSTVGGGWLNTASGANATVPGGSNNVALGAASLAAGSGAKALHSGTFVWADSQAANFVSSGDDQYLIRAAGGVGIGTAAPVMPLHVQGDTRVTGVFRSGSETGASEPPSLAGLVVRRINSTSAAVGQVVARNDHVTLERDGSNGGMLIRYPAGAYRQAIACTAMTSTGSLVNYYNTLVGPAVPSTLPIFNGATNVVQFHCTFGDSFNKGHHTEVNMIREGADFYWVGNLTSTYNQ